MTVLSPAAACAATDTDAPGAAPNDVEALVRTHLPLVGHIVRETLTRLPAHVSRDDLVSAGMYGLAAAAKSFDTTRGVPFSRFAAIRIRGAITDELRGRDWASRSVRAKARDVEEVRNSLAATLGHAPSREELATAMGIAVREVDAVEADVHRASLLSLQALTPEANDELLPADSDEPEGLLLRREQLGYLRDALAELPDRLRTVVLGHFFEGRKMLDMAAELGVTESRISQLRSEALGLLREALHRLDGAAEPPARGRAAASRTAYCAAVAARSTLADRLHLTTALGELRTPLSGALQIAN